MQRPVLVISAILIILSTLGCGSDSTSTSTSERSVHSTGTLSGFSDTDGDNSPDRLYNAAFDFDADGLAMTALTEVDADADGIVDGSLEVHYRADGQWNYLQSIDDQNDDGTADHIQTETLSFNSFNKRLQSVHTYTSPTYNQEHESITDYLYTDEGWLKTEDILWILITDEKAYHYRREYEYDTHGNETRQTYARIMETGETVMISETITSYDQHQRKTNVREIDHMGLNMTQLFEYMYRDDNQIERIILQNIHPETDEVRERITIVNSYNLQGQKIGIYEGNDDDNDGTDETFREYRITYKPDGRSKDIRVERDGEWDFDLSADYNSYGHQTTNSFESAGYLSQTVYTLGYNGRDKMRSVHRETTSENAGPNSRSVFQMEATIPLNCTLPEPLEPDTDYKNLILYTQHPRWFDEDFWDDYIAN